MNKYEEALNEQIEILKKCQEEHQLKSCFLCDNLFECALRDEYVKAVYESMSKGQGGGFEF